MRSDICSIPVEEVFEPKEGCPICRMRNMLEQRMAEYITGAAMMEPEVRKVTNQKGFCLRHYKMILSRHNRLSVALMLESHLKEIEKTVKSPISKPVVHTCFVCDEVKRNMESLISNTLKKYESDMEFRHLFDKQETLCLPHFHELTAAADKKMGRRFRGEFKTAARKLTLHSLTELHSDVKHFCDMFDYRNSGENADWGNSRDSLERAVDFLTSFHPEEKM